MSNTQTPFPRPSSAKSDPKTKHQCFYEANVIQKCEEPVWQAQPGGKQAESGAIKDKSEAGFENAAVSDRGSQSPIPKGHLRNSVQPESAAKRVQSEVITQNIKAS